MLHTLFSLDGDNRIVGTLEPDPNTGPMFYLIRGKGDRAWAVRSDVPQHIAIELDALAREEPPITDFRDAPVNAERYLSLIEGRADSGPAFEFPAEIADPGGTVFVEEKSQLDCNFAGWTNDEIPYRSPIVAVIEDGHSVSVCFCARRTDVAAEAGVETAVEYRGQGLAPRVTAAWAIGDPSIRSRPALQHLMDEPRIAGRRSEVGFGPYASTWSIS